MALSVVAIKAAKGRDKPYKLADHDGLYLLVASTGARYWRMNYRHLGKQKTLSFGAWPEVGLAEARQQRDAARKVIARGDDPAEQIKLERIAASVASASSFEAVAAEWLTKVEKEGRSSVTTGDYNSRRATSRCHAVDRGEVSPHVPYQLHMGSLVGRSVTGKWCTGASATRTKHPRAQAARSAVAQKSWCTRQDSNL